MFGGPGEVVESVGVFFLANKFHVFLNNPCLIRWVIGHECFFRKHVSFMANLDN